MTSITNCPTCQTQFIVTDEQLNQHSGKVRCGNCLHVFDATKEIIDENSQAETALLNERETNNSTQHQIIDDNHEQNEIVDNYQMQENLSNNFTFVKDGALSRNTLYKWNMGILIFLLVIVAILQSIYFSRTQIAINYPNLKSYLVQACDLIACKIDLPRKIEFIIIDDSDMQEDAEHIGLIHLSSTLINQASFNQAYPNIELTLTDVEDKPKLRRIFKPEEYLPKYSDIESGLAGSAEVKVKLALTAEGESVAGYRLAVNY